MDRAAQVLERLKGPVVPINVCFNEDGTVNYAAVREYVDWLCEEKIPVLMLTYGSSEFMGLSDKEIWELTATVARANAGRALCIASTGFWKPAQTRDFLQHADSVGVDAVKVQIHPWFPKTQAVLAGYFDRIESASDIPLLLWGHMPPPFPVDVAAQLAQRPNIVGMKNDGDPFYSYYDLIRATRDQDFAVVSGGQMRNFVFGYPIGSPAYLCPIAPFRPDIALAFYRLLVEGDIDAAWQMVFRYEEPWLQWATEASERTWIAVMKSAVQLQGLYPNNLPAPPNPAPAPGLLDEVRAKLEATFGVACTR
ncbi:MAG: dihydrodipicolinate synthase family protein [Candidatus Latescibacteria bacterium]|nr:dihydrodipicolinate synthase family protein [Candidatus Latescibacterota bacterium]